MNKQKIFTTKSQAVKDTGLSYLGAINSSTKLAKNGKVSNQYTYILYLMPHKASGYNVCPMATKECISGCLNTSGRVILDTENKILNSRIAKTKLFFEQREFFMTWLFTEIKNAQKKAVKDGYGFSVRLNGTSDINWSAYKLNGLNVFETFQDVQFYDYTKIPNRFDNMPKNYHLTFSYTGYNWIESKIILNKGFNLAVIFNVSSDYRNLGILPMTFKGYEVINGDLTDYRVKDGKGIIIGLRWKRIANKTVNEQIRTSPFVVQPNDKDCGYITSKEIQMLHVLHA